MNKCKKCGAEMKQRIGKNGAFWGCSTYPSCDYTEKVELSDYKASNSVKEAYHLTPEQCRSNAVDLAIKWLNSVEPTGIKLGFDAMMAIAKKLELYIFGVVENAK